MTEDQNLSHPKSELLDSPRPSSNQSGTRPSRPSTAHKYEPMSPIPGTSKALTNLEPPGPTHRIIDQFDPGPSYSKINLDRETLGASIRNNNIPELSDKSYRVGNLGNLSTQVKMDSSNNEKVQTSGVQSHHTSYKEKLILSSF